MGNCTGTVKKRDAGIGDHVEVTATVNLSTSYATGGDTVPLAVLGLKTIRALLICGGATTPGGHAIEVLMGATEVTAPLLRIRDAATGAQLTNATDNSAQSMTVVAKGDHAYS